MVYLSLFIVFFSCFFSLSFWCFDMFLMFCFCCFSAFAVFFFCCFSAFAAFFFYLLLLLLCFAVAACFCCFLLLVFTFVFVDSAPFFVASADFCGCLVYCAALVAVGSALLPNLHTLVVHVLFCKTETHYALRICMSWLFCGVGGKKH